jgi:hypothetical protein
MEVLNNDSMKFDTKNVIKRIRDFCQQANDFIDIIDSDDSQPSQSHVVKLAKKLGTQI